MFRPTELGRLFDAHAARLVLYARQWLTRPAAEDVVQEAFVRPMGQRSAPENPRAWLFTVVRNAAISDLRGERRRIEREQGRDEPALFDRAIDTPLAAQEASAALTTLPGELREVLTLRIWGALTFQEIAAVTQTPLSSVHFRYQQALRDLRTRLEEPCRRNE